MLIIVLGITPIDDLLGQCDVKELAKINSGNSTVQRFGGSVAISDNHVLVGFSESGGAQEAYMFEGTGITWNLDQTLVPSDAGQGFGQAIALSGSLALVGAPNDDVGATNSGSVYVFEKQAGGWVEIDKLTQANPNDHDHFGSAVHIEGNVAAVGAPEDDTLGADVGSVYLFLWNGSSWSNIAKILPADVVPNARFGRDVELSGSTVVVGTNHDAVYVFEQIASTWWQTAKLTPPTGTLSCQFGFDVSISGDRILVGDQCEPSSSNGTTNEPLGAAYVYQRLGAFWGYETRLLGDGGRFGQSVAIDGENILIGADETYTGASRTGSAYVFSFDGQEWPLDRVERASSGNGDRFGVSVAMSGQEAVIGASWNNSIGTNTGAAYIRQVYPTESFEHYGSGCAGSGGFVPTLELSGCGAPGDAIRFAIDDGPGGALALFFLGTARTSLPLGNGCTFLTSPFSAPPLALPLIGQNPGEGELVFMVGVPVPPPLPSFTVQAILDDPGVLRGYCVTNAAEAALDY